MKPFKDEWALKIGKVAGKSKLWREEKNVCRKRSLVNRQEKNDILQKHLFAVAEIFGFKCSSLGSEVSTSLEWFTPLLLLLLSYRSFYARLTLTRK